MPVCKLLQAPCLSIVLALAAHALAGGGAPAVAADVSNRSDGHAITPTARKSIDRGLNWLVSAMRRDGGLGTDLNKPTDLSCTAITGLAFLAEGNTPFAGPHCVETRRVLDAVLNIVGRLPAGDDPPRPHALVRRKIGHNADLFLSAWFLSQVLGDCADYEQEVRESLEKLVVIICLAQGEDGTWGDESWAPVLGTVLGWECLRASSSAGIKINASANLAGAALLKKLQLKTERTGDWMQGFYKNASSVRVLYSLNYRDHTDFREAVQQIIEFATQDARPFVQAGGEEYLAFFLVTECLLQQTDQESRSWYPLVRDKLIRVQNSDGSWNGHHCIKDRTFCTAAAVLTMQAPNLAMPTSTL